MQCRKEWNGSSMAVRQLYSVGLVIPFQTFYIIRNDMSIVASVYFVQEYAESICNFAHNDDAHNAN